MNDLTPYLVQEFLDDYEQGRLTRRDALRLIGGMTGAALAVQMVDARAQTSAPAMMVPAAAAMRVAADDPAVVAEYVKIPVDGGEIAGYVAHPAKPGRFPIVLVVHENRGLTPHIEDVTRRLAKAGYVGVAADLLSREGGTGKLDPDSIPGLLGKQPQGQSVADFQAALKYAKTLAYARPDRVGIVGFCFGGGVAWRMAAATPDVVAVVPYYGQPVQAADVAKLQGAVLAIYGGNDNRINAMIPAIEAAMQENHKTFRKVVYPGAGHAFNNDMAGSYNPEAAKAAWDETLAWFGKYLS
jgi:carboxymethylenebutenolidase